MEQGNPIEALNGGSGTRASTATQIRPINGTRASVESGELSVALLYCCFQVPTRITTTRASDVAEIPQSHTLSAQSSWGRSIHILRLAKMNTVSFNRQPIRYKQIHVSQSY